MHEKYRGYRKFIPLRAAVPATRNERKYLPHLAPTSHVIKNISAAQIISSSAVKKILSMAFS